MAAHSDTLLSLQQLARALGGDINNGQVLAPGPGHSSADRSLAVRPNKDAPGGLLVHSFAGDDPVKCLDYVRLKAGLPAWQPNGGRRRATDTDIDNALRAIFKAQPGGKKFAPVVAHYDYTDENGVLLYQVQRHEPKSFSQRRPNGNGGWDYQLGDVRRVLYRLSDLLKYPDGTVFICEGEKDADRVASLGHCATTVASGKWTDDCVKALANRDVLILEDADEPGRKKALKVAQALHGIAATVRIVRLPGLTGHPNNQDVSDWLDSDSHRAEKLVDDCFEARLWTPDTAEAAAAAGNGDHDEGHVDGDRGAADSADTGKPVTNSDKATAPRTAWTVPALAWRDPETIPRRVFLYGHYYARGFVSATIANGGMGKSLLKIAEFLACATGLPLLGITPIERVRTLYWNGDDPYVEVERRIHAACQHFKIDLKQLLEEHWLFVGARKEQPLCIAGTKGRGGVTINQDAIADICTFIKENDIGLACFDRSNRCTECPKTATTIWTSSATPSTSSPSAPMLQSVSTTTSARWHSGRSRQPPPTPAAPPP